MSNKVGYIVRFKDKDGKEQFKYREAVFTRIINSRGDKIKAKLFWHRIDYEEIVENAKIMKDSVSLILVNEPFLVDDELREKVTKWVDWANTVAPREYDPFAR